VPVLSKPEEYTALGVPQEWVEPLQKLGYTTIEKLKEVEKPGKLANDLNGYKKKNKLDLPGLSPEAVAGCHLVVFVPGITIYYNV
jgi:lysyl-tRNA synthetase class 2